MSATFADLEAVTRPRIKYAIRSARDRRVLATVISDGKTWEQVQADIATEIPDWWTLAPEGVIVTDEGVVLGDA